MASPYPAKQVPALLAGNRPQIDRLGGAIDQADTQNSPNTKAPELKWRRNGNGWLLVAGRRRFGRVVSNQKYLGMWRPIRLDGRLGDMANLAWAKNSVLAAAERELEWEEGQRRAIDPLKCPEKRGVFEGPSSLVRQTAGATSLPAGKKRP